MKHYTLEDILKAIEKENAVLVHVDLHLHYDKDEDFDYTGEHYVSVSVFKDEKNALVFVKVGRDLTDLPKMECIDIHHKLFKEIKDKFGMTIKNVYTHN